MYFDCYSTTAVFSAVKKRLALVNPLIIGISPDKATKKYSVESKGRIDTLSELLINCPTDTTADKFSLTINILQLYTEQ